MRIALAAASALALGLVGAAASDAYVGTRTTRCSVQPPHYPAREFRGHDNVRVGPLVFWGLRHARSESPENVFNHDGWKSPVFIGNRHRARVTIARSARSYARLTYAHGSSDDFSSLPHTVRFRGCRRLRDEGAPRRYRYTFWAGGFRLTQAPACVPVSISVDGRPARRRVVAFARPSCPSG